MRFIRRKLGLVAVGLALGSSGPAMAHHSFAMFDHTKNVTLDGTVKAFTWQNPHIWIQVLAPQAPGGTVVDWTIEGGSVNILARRGWAATVVKPGDKVYGCNEPAQIRRDRGLFDQHDGRRQNAVRALITQSRDGEE